MVALGTTAPVASVTTPLIPPVVVDCPRTAGHEQVTARTASTAKLLRMNCLNNLNFISLLQSSLKKATFCFVFADTRAGKCHDFDKAGGGLPANANNREYQARNGKTEKNRGRLRNRLLTGN